jgi:hypothetical protein
MPLSTRRPNELPAPARLKAICKSIAVLEAAIAPDEDDRCYSYDPAWGKGVECASADFGEGDTCFVWFGKAGTVIVGFGPDAGPRDPDDVFAGLPKVLDDARTEPAFGGDVSFALWHTTRDDRWRTGKVGRKDDGSARLLAIYEDHPRNFIRFAAEVHEHERARRKPRDLMRWVERPYDGKSITPDLLRGVNPALAPRDVKRVLALASSLGLPTSKSEAVIKPLERRGKPPRAPRNGRLPPPKPDAHDAAFLVTCDRDVVALRFGSGPPKVSKKNPDLYDHLVNYVRRAIEAAEER